MALNETRARGIYLSALKDGKLHREVAEGTEGAVKREYETSAGEKGSKWEKLYDSVTGTIAEVAFRKTDFGDQLSVRLSDGDDTYFLNLNTAGRYASDLMKKLPNINVEKPVTIAPYNFKDEHDKTRSGITLTQDGEKVANYYWDTEKKEAANGFPTLKKTWDKLSANEQKKFWIDVESFLVEETKQRFAALNEKAHVAQMPVNADLPVYDPADIQF